MYSLTNSLGVKEGRKDNPLISRNRWHDALLQNSFSGVELAMNNDEKPTQTSNVLVSRATGNASSVQVRPIKVIIEREVFKTLPDFICHLGLGFEQQGCQPSITSFGSQSPSPENTYIVIDNGKRPLLLDPTAEIFENVVALLKNGINILWISVHAKSSADRNPEKALITRLARSAHSENENLHLVTMDIQQALEKYHFNLIETIIKVLSQSIRTPFVTNVPREREYIYIEGQLLIRRVIPNLRASEFINGAIGKPLFRSAVCGQPDRPLKLYMDNEYGH